MAAAGAAATRAALSVWGETARPADAIVAADGHQTPTGLSTDAVDTLLAEGGVFIKWPGFEQISLRA